MRERLAERQERGRPPPGYRADRAWEPSLHALLGAPWPCASVAEFRSIWSDAVGRLVIAGLATGRGVYGGWDDADTALARALWCILVHTSAHVVIETGVARGLTTRVVLEALERRGNGRLWSIDVPPLIERGLSGQIGAAVPVALRDRWQLVLGSSRRRLGAVLAESGQVDAFVHDSMHTTRNLRFELESVWPVLRPGGVILADDIDRNHAFAEFTAATPGARAIIAAADDGSSLFGIIRKDAAAVTTAAA